MAFTFPVGFSAASTRLGSYYNGDARTPQNPGGFDQYGYVENFVPALRDVTAAGQGIAAFADYLNGTVSPLAQQAVDAAAQVAQDKIATAADRVQTGQDRTATGQDRTATGQDKLATAADRVVTGQDRTATGQDKVVTGQDRIATGQDRTATGQDRVQTGQDRAAAAVSANKLSGTSASSNTIGTGAKTFTTQADKFFGAGSTVTISSDSNPSGVQMSGVVTGYSGTTLTVNAQRTAGTGTYADWTIRVSGAAGSNGATGWTPVLANVADGIRIVQQVIDWTGGTGGKPATGLYVSASGLTGTIADATNVRGASGSGSGNVNPSGPADTNHVALFADATGNLIKSGGLLAAVATSGDYGDLAGTPTIPTVPGDIGAAEASALAAFIARRDNPNEVTKAQVGLGNVANLAPADLPLSDDTVEALALKADLVGGVIPESQIPAVAITDVYEAASQAAMLALTAQRGDVAVRSDLNKTFMLRATPATTLANWVELRTPTDAVLSIAGKTGAVTLVAADISDASLNGRSLLAAANYATMRSLLGLVIGTDVQAHDPDLAAIAGQANTTFGRGLLTLADAAGLLAAAGGLAAASKATAAQRRALTDDTTYLTPKSDADAMTFFAESVTGTKSIDWSLGWNRTFNLTGNLTLGQHTSLKDGQSGVAYFVQDATGSRTIAANTTYNKFAGGTVWTLSTAANAVDRAGYVIRLRGGTLVTEWGGLEKGIA